MDETEDDEVAAINSVEHEQFEVSDHRRRAVT